MKRLILLAVFFGFAGFTQSFAQLEIGYVDSDAIMEQLPDAQDAQKKIDALIAEWQEELDKMQQDWEKKYDQYQDRKLIMSDQKRVEVEQELVDLENKISKFRQEKFGVNGELFAKQEEIMEPVNNKIFNAIQEVAKEEELDFVFDRSGDILFLYAKEEYDITSLVLEKLK
jgi:outer membrane protein